MPNSFRVFVFGYVILVSLSICGADDNDGYLSEECLETDPQSDSDLMAEEEENAGDADDNRPRAQPAKVKNPVGDKRNKRRDDSLARRRRATLGGSSASTRKAAAKRRRQK